MAGKSSDEYTLVAASSDGTTLIGDNAAYGTFYASASGNDTLIGGTGDDTFYAGSGNDYVQGNGGNDTYIVSGVGTNTVTIEDNQLGTGQSVVQFTDAASSTVVASRSGNDLVLTNALDPVIIQNYFSSANNHQITIQFTDGVTWTAQQFQSLMAPSYAQETLNTPGAYRLWQCARRCDGQRGLEH